MIRTLHLRLEEAAEVLQTSADKLLIAATEGRIRIYGMLAEFRMAELVRSDADPFADAPVEDPRAASRRRKRFFNYVPVPAWAACVLIKTGQCTVDVLTTPMPLNTFDGNSDGLRLGPKADEGVTIAWEDREDESAPDFKPATVFRDHLFMYLDDVMAIREGRLTPEPDSVHDTEPIVRRGAETRTKNTLLSIIAALAEECEIDVKERGAAVRIAGMTELTGASFSAETVKKYLDMIPDAVERRAK